MVDPRNEPFNQELKVGDPAMIIGCRNPENSHVIGKMVVIEALVEAGKCLPPEFTALGFVAGHISTERMAIVSGIHTHYLLIENHANIAAKYLMPLPPLDDDAIIFANENVKETEKCS